MNRMSKPRTTTARLQCPERHQVEMFGRSLDDTLPPEHKVRAIWAYVDGLDLSSYLAQIKSVEGSSGHPAVDPRILLSLWLLAYTDSCGSAREIDRRCEVHLAYRWLCGDVGMNHHTLSDFRRHNNELFSELLTESVAALMHEELVDLEEVAQDGMRVRASAGSKTFRRGATLEECLKQAKEHVAALNATADESGSKATARQQAARKRAACERQERIERAIAAQQQLAARRAATAAEKGVKSREPRASTTDPDATVMKMADGGFRPAFNVEFATDTKSGIIVGVDVIKVGSDRGQLAPMVEQLEARYETTPERILADGDFATLDDVETLAAKQVEVVAPVKNAAKQQAKGIDPYQAKPTDGEGVKAWRQRMGEEATKEIYQRRASTAEWVNARARNMGMRQFLVRGLEMVKAAAVLFALASNMVQTFALRAATAEQMA